MKTNTNKLFFAALALIFCVLYGCSKSNNPVTPTPVPTLSSAKDITAFSFSKASNTKLAADVVATVDAVAHTITATVPLGTNVMALMASFSNSANSVLKVGNVVQTSGTAANDFTASVIYTVTAQDGSTQSYTTTVAIANAPVDVYMAGNMSEGDDIFAGYWKNGVAIKLTARTSNNAYALGYAFGIAASGSDVYVAGKEFDYTSQKCVAKLWKNGVATSLTDGSHDAEAYSVAISGNDVYVSGIEWIGGHSVAKLWKNGVATSLTDGSHNAEAFSVAINGSDVYVAGYEFVGGITVAKYWKNGVSNSLSDGTKDASAQSIAVNGTNIYIAGSEVRGVYSAFNVARLWKNGVAIPLTDGTNESKANSVAISGNDVYVAGYELVGSSTVAKLWKNGAATTLTGSLANAVAINGSDVYVAGYQLSNLNNGINAKLWKNGVATALTDASTLSVPRSIALVH